MKKVLKLTSLMLLLVCVCTLASCSKISQGYADKINKAADKNEHYTYAEVIEDLGDEAVALGVGGDYYTGWVFAVKGCESLDDIEAKLEEGKTVKGIRIDFLAGKARNAEYSEITEDDLK